MDISQKENWLKLVESLGLEFASDENSFRIRYKIKSSRSKSYFIVLNGKKLPMKAIARAFRERAPEVMTFDDIFSEDEFHSVQVANFFKSIGVNVFYEKKLELLTDEGDIPRDVNKAFTLAVIKQRRGQTKFRSALMECYKYACVVTGCKVQDVLEAAHIVFYAKAGDHDISNGLLLRADIHTLFDLDLIKVKHDDLRVKVDTSISDPQYRELHDKVLSIPVDIRPKVQKSLYSRNLEYKKDKEL